MSLPRPRFRRLSRRAHTDRPHPLTKKGMSLSNEMLILGRKLSAQEALASGLVSTVVTADSREAFLLQASVYHPLLMWRDVT